MKHARTRGLVVSVDPVAYMRAARNDGNPDPIHFALRAEMAGAGGIRAHFRQDRRFIDERDIEMLGQLVKSQLYLQIAPNQEVLHTIHQLRPNNVVFINERREDLGGVGLDVILLQAQLKGLINNIDKRQTRIFLFVEPQFDQIRMAAKLEVDGLLINVRDLMLEKRIDLEGKRVGQLRDSVRLSAKYGLETHLAGGVRFEHLSDLAGIEGVSTVHVGHNLVARSLYDGVGRAVEAFLARL